MQVLEEMLRKPKYIVVLHNRFSADKKLSETVYDTEWNPQHISLDEHFEISNIVTEKPRCLDELLKISGMICKDYSVSALFRGVPRKHIASL